MRTAEAERCTTAPAAIVGTAMVLVLYPGLRPALAMPSRAIDRGVVGKSPVYRYRFTPAYITHVSQDLDCVPHRTWVGFMMFYCALVPGSR